MKITEIAKNLLAEHTCDTCDWNDDFYGCKFHNDMKDRTCKKWESIGDIFADTIQPSEPWPRR